MDAWATSYVHILRNSVDGAAHPVVEWVKGSALRPVLAALDAEQGEAFLAALLAASPDLRPAPATAPPEAGRAGPAGQP